MTIKIELLEHKFVICHGNMAPYIKVGYKNLTDLRYKC